MLTGWTARGWALLRLLLGTYLTVHFVGLLPWAGELFAGMGTTSVSPLFKLVPSLLWLSPSPAMAVTTVAVGTAASIAFAMGLKDRWAAGILLWVLASLLAANPLIANPALPHVGWMLLAHTTFAQPPSLWTLWRDREAGHDWRLPPEVVTAGWVVAMLAYGYSGWTKLDGMSWADGSALQHVLSNPLARDTPVRTLALTMPGLLRLATWGALFLELSAPLLACVRPLRPWLWLGLLVLQGGLLLLVDFADLTWGMLMLQAWLFDPAWLPRVTARGRLGVARST